MQDFKEFDKNVFCNGAIILHVDAGDPEAYYKLQFEPLITITQPDQNDIACNDIVIITNEVSQGFSSNSYIWQYHFGDSNWANFPDSYQGNSSLSINSFFFNSYLGNVFIQVKSCSLVSNTVTYNVISCSPQLLEPVETKKTTCNYSEDGSFTFSVDRDLLDNEKLIATLYYEYITGYDLATNPQREITSLQVLPDGSFGYTWSEDLAPGVYQLKYQTLKGGGGINPTDGSWASIVPSDEFTIGKPSKVNFEITNTANQNCFKVNDGYIDISATGESDRFFLYQLKKDNVIQIFNGTNWVNYTGNNADNETWFPFTNAQTTRISNLNKGAYSVKVRDSEECLAK